jgi:protein-tyrosine phosphatase
MGYKHVLPVVGLLLIVLGWVDGGWALLLAWLGGDFVALGVAHWLHAHRLFGKRSDGTIPLWRWGLFLPYLAYYGAVWHLLRLLSREPACSPITKTLAVGRRLRASELEQSFDNYVDLTAEVVEPAAIRRTPAYRCFPILDGAAPTPEALRQSVTSLRPGRTFVHCAQGHGRSGLYALAILLSSGVARTVVEGLQMLRAARPGIALNREQQQCIRAFAQLIHPEKLI